MIRTFYDLVSGYASANGCQLNMNEEDATAMLVVDGFSFRLEFVENKVAILLWTPVGFLPEKGLEEFYRMLLSANNMLIGTNGFTLGLNDNMNLVTLQLIHPLSELDKDGFENIIGNMLLVAEYWLAHLHNWTPSEQNADDSHEQRGSSVNFIQP